MAVKSRRVPVIVGPTASGKTAVALRLAGAIGAEIISADSRQVYRYLDAGTAKPTLRERESVRHHFIDVVDPDAVFTAGEFGEKGRAVVDDIFSRGLTPIVVGGSGLYIRSLVDGLFEGPGADTGIRDQLEERIKRGELPSLLEELRNVDPASAARIDPTKPRRVVRALEVYLSTGIPLSELQSTHPVEVKFTPCFYGLLWERKALYARIDRRCDEMVAGGLLEEAVDLERRGYGRELNALNTVGYRESLACIHGEINRSEMLVQFRQNSRRYAKRQMTWFRRDERVRWIEATEASIPEKAAETIQKEFRRSRVV